MLPLSECLQAKGSHPGGEAEPEVFNNQRPGKPPNRPSGSSAHCLRQQVTHDFVPQKPCGSSLRFPRAIEPALSGFEANKLAHVRRIPVMWCQGDPESRSLRSQSEIPRFARDDKWWTRGGQ